jgi:hypothetical protein
VAEDFGRGSTQHQGHKPLLDARDLWAPNSLNVTGGRTVMNAKGEGALALEAVVQVQVHVQAREG